jgi:signal transduction histidine kinase
MPATAWLRKYDVEIAWAVFAAANWVAMVAAPSWETIPFHFVWISLTMVYGFRVWSNRGTALVLAAVVAATGASIMADAFEGVQLWGELFEVPLMSAMFLAMVWHARRRRAAVDRVEGMLDLQAQFLQDVSHELRTPVTIARGHLELLRPRVAAPPELAVALDELGRIERIIARLLLLAKAEHPEFIAERELDVQAFVEDLFMRWSEIAPRRWVLGSVSRGTIRADEEALRAALDALLENAVKHTAPHETIEVRARGLGDDVLIEIADEGTGVPDEAAARIFDRFARADDARTRAEGGVGLGLALVSAVAAAHGGSARLVPSRRGATFALQLPGFTATGGPYEPPVTTPAFAD